MPSPDLANFRFTPALCATVMTTVVANLNAAAASAGVSMTQPFSLMNYMCQAMQMKVCGTFRSSADGAMLAAPLGLATGGLSALENWVQLVTGPTCSAQLAGYTIAADLSGAEAVTDKTTCLTGSSAKECKIPSVDFPFCQCATRAGVTPFAVNPIAQKLAHPTKPAQFDFYCFETEIITPRSPTSTCGRTTSLLKIEFYADDTKRRTINGFLVKPAGAASWSPLSASWGTAGEMTLKATELKWTKAQSDGGMVCMELVKGADINSFCMGGLRNSCYMNLFDEAKDCCPVYTAGV